MPAVAEDDPDGVPVADEGRHVVGRVQGFLPVIRPARIEDARPDLLAVEPEFVMAEAGDVDHGQRDALLEVELLAQIDRAGLGVVGALMAEEQGALGAELADLAGGDPPGLPFAGMEEAGDEGGRLAPGTGPVLPAPPADLPMVAGAAHQRLAGVLERGRPAAGVDGVAVPEVAGVVPQELRGGGDEDLPGLRALAPDLALDGPRQARRGGVDAEGLVQVFATEPERRARKHGGPRCGSWFRP